MYEKDNTIEIGHEVVVADPFFRIASFSDIISYTVMFSVSESLLIAPSIS